MAYNPNNPNGQATMANSQPVVIASDQTTINTSDVSVVSQGVASASLKGYLELGAVSNSAPTYTTGQASAFSLTTAGALRVDGSAVTQPVSGTVTADTELPAAAALADAVANPTVPTVGSAILGYNGTTWDRLRTDGTDNDADPVATTGVLSVEAHVQAFNGTNFDRLRTIDAMSGTGANNTVVGIQAVGTGPGYAHRYNPTALATAANSVSTVEVEGGNTMTWGIATTTTGTFTFEATSDGTNWLAVEVFDAGGDLWVSGQNLTPTAGKTYHVACGGYRQVRIRVVTTLGATVSHIVNVSNSQQLLAGIDTGAAPHNFGYTVFHKDGEYTTAQTGTNLWVPTTGKKFVITDLTITTAGTTAGLVTLFQAASGTTAYSAGTTPAIFRGNFIPSATASPGVVKPFPVPYISTTADHTLHVTTSAAMTVYIQVNGYEI
jgi:hypothetical protein